MCQAIAEKMQQLNDVAGLSDRGDNGNQIDKQFGTG